MREQSICHVTLSRFGLDVLNEKNRGPIDSFVGASLVGAQERRTILDGAVQGCRAVGTDFSTAWWKIYFMLAISILQEVFTSKWIGLAEKHYFCHVI